MGNRKLPFGYKMELGEVVVHSQEARVVRQIYDEYLLGVSFKELAQRLEQQAISYDGDKPWNKNMVARILGDDRYIGAKGFPVILDAAALQAATERRRGQQRPTQRTEAEKALRQLGAGPPTAKVAAQVLTILNDLIQDPSVLQAPPPPSQIDAITLRRELDQTLAIIPVEKERTEEMARQVAAAQYAAIGPGEYETRRLIRLCQTTQPMKQLEAGFLRAAVSSITIRRNNKVSIRLKNQQIMEGRETP